MAIASLDNYIASAKQRLRWAKLTARTSVAVMPFSMFDIAGNPGAGSLGAGNTANGIVPTDALAGYPNIDAAIGTKYISKVEYASTVACRLTIYDRLFSCGAYSFNSDVTLASQPSYAGRVPNTDYSGLEIWAEEVTASTGNLAVQVDYKDEGGNAGDTGAVGVGAAVILGRCWQLPLAAGDKGVSQIVRVRGSVASGGTFNVNVLRRLWEGRVALAGSGALHNLMQTGLPIIYPDSALYVLVTADSTSTGIPDILIEVADG